METIEWADFEKIDIRVGTIIGAIEFLEAIKPAYLLTIDFGNSGLKKSSAQITKLYSTQELIGKQILAVLNFKPKKIGPIYSECLVLGIYNFQGVILIEPNIMANNGDKLG